MLMRAFDRSEVRLSVVNESRKDTVRPVNGSCGVFGLPVKHFFADQDLRGLLEFHVYGVGYEQDSEKITA
jgi:hypothetical protein